MTKLRHRHLFLVLLCVLAVGGLMPQPAQAIAHAEVGCTGVGTGSAGCYFQCIKNQKINVTVENETNSVVVTGTVRCGSQTKDAATTSGQTPPNNFDSGNVVAKKTYMPDDTIDPANCYTNSAPGAIIRVQCAPARNPTEAAGAAAAGGGITYGPPVTVSGFFTTFAMNATALGMTVVDATEGQAFTGLATIVGFGISDTTFLPETCAFGEGDVNLSMSGSGTGTISGSGTGRYIRVGDALKMVVAVDNLLINGVPSQSTSLALDVVLASESLCVAAPRSFASMAGAAVVGG